MEEKALSTGHSEKMEEEEDYDVFDVLDKHNTSLYQSDSEDSVQEY